MLEIETEPLTEQPSPPRGEQNNHADGPPPAPSRFHLSPRWQKFLVVLSIFGVFLFFYDTETAEESVGGGVYTTKKNGTTNNVVHGFLSSGNSKTQKLTASVLGGEQLLGLVTEQKKRFEAQLKKDYGEENFQNIFLFQNDTGELISRGRQVFGTPESVSWSRMKRKLMVKILQAQIGLAKNNRRRGQRNLLQLRNNNNTNDNNAEIEPNDRQLLDNFNNGYHAQFIWANGGHSASAAHGNFYWESYTAVMERAMKPYFNALGIDFVAKNYAMGGTSSGEEIALCTESVFGPDVDALTWDYGMTDAGRQEQWKLLMYTYHTAHMKSRPAAIGVELGVDPTRGKIYDELAELGMTTFYRRYKIFQEMQEAFPDTLGLNDEQINAMPPLVRRFKCGEGIEKGDPGCGDEKYNMTDCRDRKGQASWHPGWKMHALQGNIQALFLGEVLLDAAKDLATMSESEDLTVTLNRLIADEEEDYAKVSTSSIPPKLSPIANWIKDKTDDEAKLGDINFHELYLRRSFCHTSLLPAEIRYKGLLTQTDKVGTWATGTYDEGVRQPKADETPVEVDSGDIRLAYDPGDHDNKKCPYNTGIDYKDFFFLSSVEGWKTLTLPNDEEKKYYEIEPSKMLGVILICLATCDWNQCKGGDLRDEFNEGPLQMEVNGVPVKEYDKVGICWALKGEQNEYHWSPNAQGKYDIRAKLNAEEFSYVRFSSFILV